MALRARRLGFRANGSAGHGAERLVHMSKEVRDVIASVAPRRLAGDRRMLMGGSDSALRPAYGWIGTIPLSRQDGMASSRLGAWSPLWGGAASAST